MKKINIKNIGNKIKKDELFLHPNTLDIKLNHDIDDICPTKYYLHENNNLNTITNNYCKKINNKEIRKFMLFPPTIINYTDILQIYNVISFDDLFNKIKELTEQKKSFNTINRIINCWIKNNYDDLKNNHIILINIYKYLFKNINEIKLNNEINKWFNSNKNSNFNINLGNEIIKNLNLNI